MRNYLRFDNYVNRLSQDVYAQPPDDGHSGMGVHAIQTLCSIPVGIQNVLDIGCGQGIFRTAFENMGINWSGVTIGEDYEVCCDLDLPVYDFDMTFVDLPDNSYDLIFARHALEHSPFPIITLMEWRRLCRGWLVLIVPAPEYWGIRGRNHYSVLGREHLNWLLNRAGWKVIHEFVLDSFHPSFLEFHSEVNVERGRPMPIEYRFLCEQVEEILE